MDQNPGSNLNQPIAKGPTEASGETVKKDNKDNPLSVRIDPYYRDKFETLTQELGISKKVLLENLILSFIEKDVQDQRETLLNFTNEVNLIAAHLEEVLNTFTKITVKSQDTVGSMKSFYEQKITNLENKIQTLNEQILGLQEKNQLLTAAGQSWRLEQEKLEQAQLESAESVAAKEAEIKALNYRNLELLEQLNLLRKVERQNLELQNDAAKSAAEVQRLKELLEERQAAESKLQGQVRQLEATLAELKTTQAETVNAIKATIYQEAELNKKAALLQFQTDYNNLQGENLRNLAEINRRTEEIMVLKSRLAELTAPEKTGPTEN